MLGETLVRPLEEDWRALLDGVARARGLPGSADVARLGAAVAALSAAYNERGVAQPAEASRGASAAMLAARLGFSFARDVPKGAAAVRELVALGALALPEGRALRVLDVGAGLGATTWGVARALEAAGAMGAIEATWIDTDPAALDLAQEIARARAGAERPVVVRATTARARSAGARFDLVLLGQVLSEMDLALEPAARAEKHAALVHELLSGALEDGGALVLVEPALRERTRHLHRVRDALLALRPAPTVFAPCLHAGACPALAAEGDWCHEDLAVDLPPWLVPVARAAKLRWQGLTFSYLVLRRDGRALRDFAGEAGDAVAPVRLRVVSDVLATKGKSEAFFCGELRAGEPRRVRVARLDRDRSAENAAWSGLHRGDVVAFSPPLSPERPRVAATTHVAPAAPAGSEPGKSLGDAPPLD